MELTPETWERELSAARTFCFFEEIEFLIKNGLIKGGSLENAVVIRDDAVLTNEPLRYPEEFVRHKMLDIIGDLSLIGRPLCGHIVAIKPSHTANCELARRLVEQERKPSSPRKLSRHRRRKRRHQPESPAAARGGRTTTVDGHRRADENFAASLSLS